jgi:hypothetical protein
MYLFFFLFLSSFLLVLLSPSEVNARNNDGSTPLHWAAKWGNTKTAKLLGELGADPEARNNSGRTPLDSARGEKVKALLRNPGIFSVSEQRGVCSVEGGRRSGVCSAKRVD